MDCNLPASSVHRFPKQEYWSWLPFPSPGDIPGPGIKPMSSALLAGGFFTTEPPAKSTHTHTHTHTHNLFVQILFSYRSLQNVEQSSLCSTLGPYQLFILCIVRRVVVVCARQVVSHCDPMDRSPPVSSVHGISLANLLEWMAISDSRGYSQCREQTHISCIS